MKSDDKSYKISGVHKSPFVTKKFHTGRAACHDCGELKKKNTDIYNYFTPFTTE